ncbi:hypothetical protein ElyMa_004898200 [Elysia marginata]|uniref:Sema domain-containing protein n=1 Tax=Elysia marginata TaxID=1093978 RepID=A0AAV4IWP7_9GAST|nr:hypothetical protein ElyMa_004898200 [Elysia marginata]
MGMAAESRGCVLVSGSFRFRRMLSTAVLLLAGLVLVGDFVAVSSALDASYVSAVFETPYNNGSFRQLTVNKQTQDVYIGAVDYIYKTFFMGTVRSLKTGSERDRLAKAKVEEGRWIGNLWRVD